MSRRAKRLQSMKEAGGQNRSPDPAAKPAPTPKPTPAVQPVETSLDSRQVGKGATCCAPTQLPDSSVSITVALKLLEMLAVLAVRLAADIKNFVVGAPVPPPEGKARKARKVPVPACSLLVKSLNQLNKIANDNIRLLVKAEAPESLIAERRLQAGALLYDMGNALLNILAAEFALIGANPEPPTTDKFIKTLATLSRIVNNAEKMREKGAKVRNADCGVRNEQSEVAGPESGVETGEGATHVCAAGQASTPELARVQAVAEGPENMDAVDGVDFVDDVDVADELDELLLTELADRP